MGLLINVVNAKCVLLSNQKCVIQTTVINLHPNECSQEFNYYLFLGKLDICVERCNTLNDLSNKLCAPNKTKDLNPSVFNMITGISESLTKHVSCECKCKFNGTKCNSDQWWNNDKSRCEYKRHHVCEKGYVWNPSTCSCKNGKYLASIMDDSTTICDEVIESYNEVIKTILTNFNEKKGTC